MLKSLISRCERATEEVSATIPTELNCGIPEAAIEHLPPGAVLEGSKVGEKLMREVREVTFLQGFLRNN